MFCDSMKTFNMCVLCFFLAFFFLFCLKTQRASPLSEARVKLKHTRPLLSSPLPQMTTLRSSMNLSHCSGVP
jgi:hypothetical protein